MRLRAQILESTNPLKRPSDDVIFLTIDLDTVLQAKKGDMLTIERSEVEEYVDNDPIQIKLTRDPSIHKTNPPLFIIEAMDEVGNITLAEFWHPDACSTCHGRKFGAYLSDSSGLDDWCPECK